MIELPRRSVTRFFIPLIDVLTLLFCIFLLMPLVKPRDEDEALEGPTSPEEIDRLRQEKKELLEALETLRQNQHNALQRDLAVCVLEIDAQTGKLYYYDPKRPADRRLEVTASTVRSLVDDEQREAAGKTVYFLFLYPRPAAGIPVFPLRRQREDYDRWFADVPHGYDLGMRGTAVGPQP
jgi:hypothetical protein